MTSDPTTSPEAHLPLHRLELQLLLSLLEGPAHAYAIVRSIERRQPEWSRILPTNLYRRIWRLEAKSLIAQVDRNEGEDSGGRKYFAITELGRRVAAAEAARLRDLLDEALAAGVIAPSRGERLP